MPLTLRTFLATAFAGVVTVSLLVSPAVAQDGGLERFLAQKLAWGPCASFARSDTDRSTFAATSFDCTYLEVPLDYAHPEGRTAKLAMLRHKALDPAARIGSLFVDPGGPGGSGVSYLPTMASDLAGSEIARRFDLIGFDPRGVGASEPVIDCSNTAEVDAERVDLDIDPSPAGVAQTEAEYQDFAKRCAERVGLDVLANVGTRDVARDLQIAHKVVGDQKLTYVGYSYGTRSARSSPSSSPATCARSCSTAPSTRRSGWSNRASPRPAGSSGRSRTSPPPARNGPSARSARRCPPRRRSFQELTKPLITKPVPAGATGRTLGYADAQLGVLTALYSETLWTFMQEGLAQVARGDGTNLLRLADAYYDRNGDGSYGNLIEAFQAIGCADTKGLTDRAQALEISRQWNALAPFRDPGLGPSNALEQCSFWPVPPTTTPGPVEAPGLPTVLVVSSTGDPATPYEDGVSLAKQLKARLLSVENDSHTVALQGSNFCADAAATRYLVDLTLPAQDITCARQAQ